MEDKKRLGEIIDSEDLQDMILNDEEVNEGNNHGESSISVNFDEYSSSPNNNGSHPLPISFLELESKKVETRTNKNRKKKVSSSRYYSNKNKYQKLEIPKVNQS